MGQQGVDARGARGADAHEDIGEVALRVHPVRLAGGDESVEPGEPLARLAGLMSLLATCETSGINPEAYLADVLLRVQTHPASRIDELLPHRWRPADTS